MYALIICYMHKDDIWPFHNSENVYEVFGFVFIYKIQVNFLYFISISKLKFKSKEFRVPH